MDAVSALSKGNSNFLKKTTVQDKKIMFSAVLTILIWI
jgi:hypothetical protein